MSAAVWIRGLLQNDYGVDFSKVHWIQGATNKGGAHGNPTVPPLLKPISIEVNASGKSLSELLEAGAIDAIIGSDIPVALNRNPVDPAAVSRFSESRGRLLPAHRHLSDHAPRRGAARAL